MDRKIKSLTKKESEAISKLKLELLRQVGNDVEMILYGSKARGDSTRDSDIDILVLVNGKSDDILRAGGKFWTKLHHIAYDIERNYLDYETHIQIIVHSRKWWESWKDVLPFAQNVEREGIRL